MLALISPAKKLDFTTDAKYSVFSESDFLEQTEYLITVMVKLKRFELTRLMKISDKLVELNYNRYRKFKTPFNLTNAKQAIFAFRGDTYVGLDADTLSEDDVTYAQDHLRILSGLYGALRPLDLMQPYRLEMGTKIATIKGEDLYDFWDDKITQNINETLATHADNSVINLASNEYIKSIHRDKINGNFITPHFKETKNGMSVTIGIFAKRARGMMARYIIQNRIDTAEQLKSFTEGGYKYQEDISDDKNFIFTRPKPEKSNSARFKEKIMDKY